MANCKTAQDVKHFLHTNLFHPNKERILSFIKVSKTEPSSNPFKKKENIHYLCLHVTSSRPYQAFISRFIKSEAGDDFDRRRQWTLGEIAKVDGINEKSNKFEIWSDSGFKFEASNLQEKTKFIDDIADACKKYLEKTPPQFVNVGTKAKDIIDQATSTMSQLHKTKLQLGERGEKLSDVEKRTADMAHSAETFAENAQKLAEQYQ